jgi:hypothetical protein
LSRFRISCSFANHSPAPSGRGSSERVEERVSDGESDGAQGRDRTADTVIFSHVLYQLSYLGPRRPGGRIEEARV